MKILIIKRYEREFRIPFYKLVENKLANENITLEIYYGEPNVEEKKNIRDYVKDENLGKKVKNLYFKFLGVILCYQPCLKLTSSADVIIVQQGNRELLNYLLLFKRIFSKKIKVAFWGHGKNFQGNAKSLKERFKKWYSGKVDFWFAYNDLSRKILIDRGFNENRIVSLNNTIDSNAAIQYFDNINTDEKNKLKAKYNIELNDPVGIFCASIYEDKHISFLLDSLTIVKSKVPNIKFFIIGKGIEDYKAINFSEKNSSWVFFLGSKFAEEKMNYFSISDFQAIPGAVGLNIIDSFSFLCPLITTNINNHGPEISYLRNNQNGIMTSFNTTDYANSIINLTNDTYLKNRLKEGCAKDRKIYSIENMANNFVEGIFKIINQK